MTPAARLIAYALACAANDTPERRIQVYADAAELMANEVQAQELRLLASGLEVLEQRRAEIEAVRAAIEERHRKLLLTLSAR